MDTIAVTQNSDFDSQVVICKTRYCNTLLFKTPCISGVVATL